MGAAGASDRVRLAGARLLRGPDRRDSLSLAAIAALLVVCLAVLPAMLSLYWMAVLTGVAIYSVVAAGLGILVGRVGVVSLGQIALLALASWVGARLAFATSLPFPLLLIATGLVTVVIGVVVGLPALRLSGLYLALITLMLAGAIGVILVATEFPNGGGGFLGATSSSFGNPAVRRPSIAHGDVSFYRYTIVASLLMFGLALWHLRAKAGRAWAAIRQSEQAAVSAGINITLYKLWAIALASFMTGVAGGLLASFDGKLYYYQFPTQDSIVLLAVVLMGGTYSLWGALVAGMLMKLLPAIFDIWNVNPNLLIVLFGIGVLQVMLTAPGGIVNQLPKDIANLGRLLLRLSRKASGAGASA